MCSPSANIDKRGAMIHCAYCDLKFHPRTRTQAYCCKKCSNAALSLKERKSLNPRKIAKAPFLEGSEKTSYIIIDKVDKVDFRAHPFEFTSFFDLKQHLDLSRSVDIQTLRIKELENQIQNKGE